VDLDELRGVLTDFISEHTPRLSPHSDADTQPTQGFQRVIQRAILHVQSSGKKEVTGANVLVAIFGEKDSHAVYFLQQQGITRLDVVNYISHGITKTPLAGGEPLPAVGMLPRLLGVEKKCPDQAERADAPEKEKTCQLAGDGDVSERPKHRTPQKWIPGDAQNPSSHVRAVEQILRPNRGRIRRRQANDDEEKRD
jgi:ATP-dependent Clp protease ATP-binding subunit ClpA